MGNLPTSDMLPLNKCCPIRQKVVLSLSLILHKDFCGVPDEDLLSVMKFHPEEPSKSPTLCFNFCPWCGEALQYPTEDQIASNRRTNVHLKKFHDYRSKNGEIWTVVRVMESKAILLRHLDDKTYQYLINGILESGDRALREDLRITEEIDNG